jgi:hypothetical protein
LITPKTYERYEPWDTYKRRLITNGLAGEGSSKDQGVKGVGTRRSKGRRASTSVSGDMRAGGLVEAEGMGKGKAKGKRKAESGRSNEVVEVEVDANENDEEDGGEDNDQEGGPSDQQGLSQSSQQPKKRRESMATADPGLSSKVGKYKRRDMREAFDGSALIALGGSYIPYMAVR